jgi:hypothetical protein
VLIREGNLRAAPVFDGSHAVLRVDGELICVGSDSPSIREKELDTLARSAMTMIGMKPMMEMMSLNPPAEFEPPPGVPVCQLVPNVPPAHWLMAGPYPMVTKDNGPSDQAMAALFPKPGDSLTVGGKTASFAPLPEDVGLLSGMVMLYRSEGTFYTPTTGLDLGNAVGGEDRRSVYFYTVVECTDETTVNFRCNIRVQAWMAGRALGSVQALHLKAGYYPLVIRADIDAIPPVGKVIATPRFNPILSGEKAEADWVARIARHEAVLRKAAATFEGRATGIRAERLLDVLDKSREQLR